MTQYYPQAVAVLRVVWEDFGDEVNPLLRKDYTVTARCKNIRVDINSYREADTFDLDLDYKHFPFDPRAIRSCQVSIHMENMRSLIQGGKPVVIQPNPDNVVFIGFADEDNMSFNDSTRTVKLKGRDFTSIFLDAKYPGTLIDLHKPLNLIIQDLVSGLPGTGGVNGIKVENRTNIPTLPILGAFAPEFGALSGKKNGKPKQTYWDVMQELAQKAGLILYMEIDKLVISKPRNLYDPTKAVTFIYGKNVKNLEITRKMGKQKGFNVVVRAIIDKEVEEVFIPKDSTKLDIKGDHIYIPKQSPQGALLEKDEKTVAPFLSFSISQVNSRAHLIEVGEAIFEEISRQQLEGRFKTYDMEAPDTLGCFDILKLRNGTPVKIQIGHEDIASIERIKVEAETDQMSRELTVAKRALYLERRCYDPLLAQIFASTMGKFSTTFYTRSVSYTLSAQNGFTVDVDFVNFIETDNLGLGGF